MDYRLALLLHFPLGLKFSKDDLARLFAGDLSEADLASVLAAASSEEARHYLTRFPQWLEVSAKILEVSEARGVRWSYFGQADYPAGWRGLSRRPLIFSYLGEPVWLTTPLIAVVGSRTPGGETLSWMQSELSRFLKISRAGVVSGGARGVDQWAHRISMDVRRPTVCVLPTGILNPYPPRNEAFWERIVSQGGCLLSTCSLTEPVRKHFFEIRNRWIAGLSPVCLVTEANRRSGSLITAKAASEEHRDVCTLPVFPTAHQGLGNLDLIRDGAFMIRDHLDLLTLWNASVPNLFQRAERESQESEVH